MNTKLTTVIPVYNAEAYVVQTLESVSRQSRRPDRVVVVDNCSTDNTEKLVKEFKGLPCEWMRNPSNLGLLGNCNRALEFADQTQYLQILHADDLLEPGFYETLLPTLEDCQGFGLAYCLDERIDDNGQHLSVSGRATGQVTVLGRDEYLRERAEIGNQAFCATLLKTDYQKTPCLFRLDIPILADMVFWPDWGRHCQKIVKLASPLGKYRWHGTNATNSSGAAMVDLNALVLDEWRTMQIVEGWREQPASVIRRMKLKGLFAVRSGIKAKRFRELGNRAYSRRIVQAARPVCGLPLWLMGQTIVHSRDWVVYGLLGRKKHPKNVFG